jgi:hypothetical protein
MNDVAMTLRAAAFQNENFFFVYTRSGDMLMFDDPDGKHIELAPSVDDKELGKALLDALGVSRCLTIHESNKLREKARDDGKKRMDSLRKKYGYKTYSALVKSMKNCDISWKGSMITVEPSHHEKNGGWSGEGISEGDYVEVAANSSPADIGAALRLAFSRCT